MPETSSATLGARARAAAAQGESTADACYQQAEIHRLRGDWAAAETAYRSASQHGRDPQPGMALLRLGQGRAGEAARSIRLALGAISDRLHRARLLPALVEIMVAAAHLDEAKQARDELVALARQSKTEVLGAMAAHATATVALAEDEPAGALEPLRGSLRVWQHAGAPYIVARQRLLLARAYRRLGDEDSAGLELGLARECFTRLGAGPDLAALEAPLSPEVDSALSAREVEVLRFLAAGKTNKAIAKTLYLSEKTIDRHVSNIFHKIDVASRSAATAYAYETGLVVKTAAQEKQGWCLG
jgi:DNA-binding CsgD family transcriptional regulator